MPKDASISELHASSDSDTNGPLPLVNEEISLLDLLVVLAERKRTILAVTGILVVSAAIVSFVLPKRYTASVLVLPPQQNSSMGAALASQLGNLSSVASLAGGGLGLKNPNDMYVAMFKSRAVEDAMVQSFDLMQEYRQKFISDARKSFEQHVTVDGSRKDGLIYISVDDRDPKRAAELANGYIDQFRRLSEHLAITEASQRRLFLEQQLERAKDNLANAEEAMKLTEQKTGMIQLDSQARALIESAASLRAQVVAKEVQIQSIRTFATSENSQLVQAQNELDSLRVQLARLGGGGDIDGGLIVPKGQMPAAGIEYVRKLRDVKYYETIFEILARQFELAKLDEAKQGALIQVIDAAVPPDRRSFPKRGLIIITSGVVGLFLGFILALAQSGLERIKSSPETARKVWRFRKALSVRRRGSD